MRPDRRIVCEQGVTLFKGPKSGGHFVLRLGRDGFLSNECHLPLCIGRRAPSLHVGKAGSRVIYDAFPLETGISTGSRQFMLCAPSEDSPGVAFVRFSFGGQVPVECRADCYPIEGTPNPVAISTCALNRKPWPSFSVDGAWVVCVGDVFAVEADGYRRRLELKENGMIET